MLRVSHSVIKRTSMQFAATGSLQELVSGAVRFITKAEGWVEPSRFTKQQYLAYTSCMSWHPGLYRQMMHTTSGMKLSFTTKAKTIALDVCLLPVPSHSTTSLNWVINPTFKNEPLDGVELQIDGRRFGFVLTEAHGGTSDTQLLIEIQDSNVQEHVIDLWLPNTQGVLLKNWYADKVLYPHQNPLTLLVLGDSLSQGFVSQYPSISFPSLFASSLRMEFVNQAIGAAVFQASGLADIAQKVHPDAIVVEFGANYRFERCSTSMVKRDIENYFTWLNKFFYQIPTVVITPFWHSDELWPNHPNCCFHEVAGFIEQAVARYEFMQVVDGLQLMDHTSEVLCDNMDHPNAQGMIQITKRLLQKLEHTAWSANKDVFSPERIQKALIKVQEFENEVLQIACEKTDEESYVKSVEDAYEDHVDEDVLLEQENKSSSKALSAIKNKVKGEDLEDIRTNKHESTQSEPTELGSATEDSVKNADSLGTAETIKPHASVSGKKKNRRQQVKKSRAGQQKKSGIPPQKNIPIQLLAFNIESL